MCDIGKKDTIIAQFYIWTELNSTQLNFTARLLATLEVKLDIVSNSSLLLLFEVQTNDDNAENGNERKGIVI